jgi:hypothetical protein
MPLHTKQSAFEGDGLGCGLPRFPCVCDRSRRICSVEHSIENVKDLFRHAVTTDVAGLSCLSLQVMIVRRKFNEGHRVCELQFVILSRTV